MADEVVELVAIVECAECALPTVVGEVDQASGECAACSFVGWVMGHEAWLVDGGVGEREVA